MPITKEQTKKIHIAAALIFIDAVIFLVLANFAAAGVLYLKNDFQDKSNVGMLKKFTLADVKKAYPTYSDQELKDFIEKTYPFSIKPWRYEPFTQYQEPEYQSEFINVSPAGFRFVANQASWPPRKENFNIFVFGGSVIFGTGVADDGTIASHLQELAAKLPSDKPIKVYNFGQRGYYSIQERIFFEQLMLKGYVPDAAIFIDGVNEFRDDSSANEGTAVIVRDAMEQLASPKIMNLVNQMPVMQLANIFKNKLAQNITPTASSELGYTAAGVVSKYLVDKKMTSAIGDKFNIKTLFVWEPSSYYDYDKKNNIFYLRR